MCQAREFRFLKCPDSGTRSITRPHPALQHSDSTKHLVSEADTRQKSSQQRQRVDPQRSQAAYARQNRGAQTCEITQIAAANDAVRVSRSGLIDAGYVGKPIHLIPHGTRPLGRPSRARGRSNPTRQTG
jgi:hypothetical protein